MAAKRPRPSSAKRDSARQKTLSVAELKRAPAYSLIDIVAAVLMVCLLIAVVVTAWRHWHRGPTPIDVPKGFTVEKPLEIPLRQSQGVPLPPCEASPTTPLKDAHPRSALHERKRYRPSPHGPAWSAAQYRGVFNPNEGGK